MATPPPCPRPSLSDLPNLSLDIPAFMFGQACLPGTATDTGCPADKAYYVIVVPWEQFVAEGWTAPGGNRYWQGSMPANPEDVRARMILRMMAARSKAAFRDKYKNSNKPVAEILTPKAAVPARRTATGWTLAQPAEVWATQVGVVTVEVKPEPGETAKAFAARGGYLLNLSPDTSPFLGKEALSRYGARPWMGGNVRTVGLWATYDVGTRTIGYAVRVELKGAWKQAVDGADKWFRENMTAMCAKITGQTAATVASTAVMFPGTTPYLAAYGAAIKACTDYVVPAVSAPPAIACTPQAWPGLVAGGTAGEGITFATGGKGRPLFIDTAAVLTAINPKVQGTRSQVLDQSVAYPLGTIAWLDPTLGKYRIAVPAPGPGTTHRETVTIATLPTSTSVQVVDQAAWQRATRPWLRRTRTQYGLVGGGVAAVVAVGAGLFLRH